MTFSEILFYCIAVSYLGIALGIAYEVLVKPIDDDDDDLPGGGEMVPIFVRRHGK